MKCDGRLDMWKTMKSIDLLLCLRSAGRFLWYLIGERVVLGSKMYPSQCRMLFLLHFHFLEFDFIPHMLVGTTYTINMS